MDFEQALAESVLGLLRPELLPEICTTALMEGRDSPSLAALAGEPAATLDPIEARALFNAAVRELGLAIPSRRQAADLLVERAAADALRGRRSPYEALSRIVREIYYASGSSELDAEYVGSFLGIERIVGLYWEYDELHEPWACSRTELDQEALQALQAYLNSRAA